MALRASSLQATNTLAINREIDSKYDAVLAVRDKLVDIEKVADINIEQLLADLQEAQDFTGISVVVGDVAGWNAVTKTITVPTVKGDTGAQGVQGEQGERGLQGDTGPRGLTGAAGANGRDGINGRDGVDGINGIDGIDGNDLTVDQIVYNNDGTFTWMFSDGTSYETPDLRGPKGDVGEQGVKGDQGISVHHIKGTSTTDSEGDFGSFGEVDTYTVYGDAAETINLGYFRVNNGMAKEGQHGPMYKSTYDTNSNGVVDNSERLNGKTLHEVQDFASIHSKPTTLSGYGINDAFTKAEVTTNINNAVAELVNGAPAILDTLSELSTALDNNANFATTVANSIGDKVTKNSAIVAGTNTQITYDSKGLVTGGITPTTLAGYSINNAYTKTEGDARYESKNVNIQNHIASTSNPHGVTKTQVGLGNVDNTTDANKNVLSATKLTTPRTINGVGFNGTSNISINTNNPQVIKFDTGVTEGEDLYTFNGSSTKTIDIKAGTNITLTKTTGAITINANDTSVNLSEVQGLGTGVSTFLATPNSTNLAAALTNETGSGSLVFATSPTLVTPNIGVATGTSFNSITGLSSIAPLVAGTATIGTSTAVARADHIHPVQTSVTGNAGTATKLETARAIAGVSFDGSANIAIPFANLSTTPTTVAGYGITDVYTKTQTDANISTAVAGLVNGSPAALDTLNELAAALGNDANFATTVSTSIGTKVAKNADIVGGTSTKITYDAKGLVTGGTSLAATDIPALDWSKITTGKPTTLSGYGISDATPSSHIGTTGASHGVVTTSVNGFMSSADKTKLDGVATNANNYVHPTSGVVAGTYTKITVDSNGHATAGSTPTTLAGYSIGDAYTKTESDTSLALKTNKSDTDSVNMLRADKFLAAQNIANMIYTSGNLTKIRYNADTDSNYEVLNYTNGNLSSINHYVGGVLKGITTLSYTSGNLVSAIFA
jgi:phage-related tail fiber protein